jgi:Ca2+-binding RTX toxin-like protein
MSKLARTLSAAVMAVLWVTASASPAGAAVTIGQVAPTTPAVDCGENQDLLQPTVTSGNAYIVPAGTGAITSWSTNADADADQMLTMKVFRKIGDPATYQVVGHDGPHPLSPSLNTFPASVAVMPGDVLGLHVPSNPSLGSPSCRFSASGDTYLFKGGNLADGLSDVFAPGIANFRLNVSAVVEPDCDNDGLGDETQDTNLSSCAPGTTPTGPAPTLPSGAPATCRGVAATIVGTNGSDVRTGSQGQDVIVALGGNDTLSGLAGNDVICGGSGKDTLKGGKGKDTLLGQKGKDALNGGPSRDLCKGGKGTDTASKCEVEKSI